MNAVRIITLTARVNGVEVGRQTYDTTGRGIFARRVPEAALHRRPAEVEFELNREVRDQNRGRNLGLIALNVGLMELEGTTAYREAKSRFAREGYGKIVQQRNLRIPAADEQELMKLFHQLPVWENLWFHNVRLIKNPLDLWMMQQIIYEVQPDFIIETGTWRGGSALYWANTLEGMGLEKSRVLTVDIQDSTQAASTDRLWKKYVDFYLGSSTDPDIVSAIARPREGPQDHRHAGFRSLHAARSPGVADVLADDQPRQLPGGRRYAPGRRSDASRGRPWPARGNARVSRRTAASKEFEPDFSREKMVMTFNPGGWLRRK